MILFLVMLAVGCSSEPKTVYSPSFKDDPVRKHIYLEELKKKDAIQYECEVRGITYEEYMHELDSVLEDWPFPGAKGQWIPSRERPEDSDTIVDGFGYNRP